MKKKRHRTKGVTRKPASLHEIRKRAKAAAINSTLASLSMEELERLANSSEDSELAKLARLRWTKLTTERRKQQAKAQALNSGQQKKMLAGMQFKDLVSALGADSFDAQLVANSIRQHLRKMSLLSLVEFAQRPDKTKLHDLVRGSLANDSALYAKERLRALTVQQLRTLAASSLIRRQPIEKALRSKIHHELSLLTRDELELRRDSETDQITKSVIAATFSRPSPKKPKAKGKSPGPAKKTSSRGSVPCTGLNLEDWWREQC